MAAADVSRVLVTGAGGFIGRAVCRRLAAAGHEVVAAARTAAPGIRAIGALGPGWREDGALDGIEAVVHLAAAPPDASDAAQRATTVEGTRRLAAAAAGRGVARFVFLSSVKVHGEASGSAALGEDDALRPADAYARAKSEAERALAALGAETGLGVVVLRPPMVYGPGVGGNFAALLRLCDGPWPLPFGAADANQRSLIFVDNLADAVRAGLEHPAAAGRTYLVSDGADVSTARLIRQIRARLGRAPRLVAVPPGPMRAAARLIGCGGLARRLLGSLAVDDRRIRAELGWSPPVPPAAALDATVDAYRATRRRT